jgi:perosamine synthetase
MIPMSAPDLDDSDERMVTEALRSGVLSLGPFTEEFEHLAASRAGVGHGVAVSSGTAALHLVARSLELEAGDDVLVPSFTFAASANAFIYEGAVPVFVDIDPETYNVDPAELAARRTDRTKAAMIVDVFGHPADWDAISHHAEDLLLIEDSCEALGAEYRGRAAGSFGTAGCFAFYPNKQVTTGEGGVIVTDDPMLARRCRSLRNQGRAETDPELRHELLGFNYRLDELSAALGVSQISRLDTFLTKRSHVAQMYTERLSQLSWLRLPVVRPDVTISWFVYVVTLSPDMDRQSVVDELDSKGISTRAYFRPLHLQPYMRELFGTREGMLPITEDIAERTLALPFHNNLSEEDVERVVDALSRARPS